MEEGDKQAESELPGDSYAGFIGDREALEDLPAEDEAGAGEADEDNPEKEPESEPTENSTANPKVDVAEQYRNLQRKFGEQGNELGSLRKEVQTLREKLDKQANPPKDPFADDPTLKTLDQTQRDIVLRATDAVLSRRLADLGMSLDDLPQLKQAVQQQSEEQARTAIAGEITRLKERYGDKTFERYIPTMTELSQRYPNLGPAELFKMASFDDLQKGQTERAKAFEAERKERAKSADFGNSRPSKSDNGKLTAEALKKLSPVGHGRMSPRLAAILREERRAGG